MAKSPASTKIKMPSVGPLALASDHKPMYAGQCVLSIIHCLATCADLVESIQAEQKRFLKTSSWTWKFWKQAKTPPELNSQAEKAMALCDNIVNSANRLGEAITHRSMVDKKFSGGTFDPGNLLNIRVGIQNKLKNPMQKSLDNEHIVSDSQLDEWKILLNGLIFEALQDIQLREPE